MTLANIFRQGTPKGFLQLVDDGQRIVPFPFLAFGLPGFCTDLYGALVYELTGQVTTHFQLPPFLTVKPSVVSWSNQDVGKGLSLSGGSLHNGFGGSVVSAVMVVSVVTATPLKLNP